MTGVTLRPVQETDLGLLAANRSRDVRGLDWFGFVPANALHRRFAADGLISDDYGVLVVQAPEGDVVGQVSWFAVAEQRALEKAGFAREGVLRHAQFRDGQWRDVVLYSVLRAEVFVQ